MPLRVTLVLMAACVSTACGRAAPDTPSEPTPDSPEPVAAAPTKVAPAPKAVAHYSKQHRPRTFSDPKRREKIKAVLPQVEDMLRRHAQENHFPGFVYGVLVDGELMLSGALGTLDMEQKHPVTLDSKFHIASMTKSVTAMAILKLRDQGKLRLRDPVENYLPELEALEYPSLDSPLITIENLLTMTAGFPEDNPWADRHLEDSTEDFQKFVARGMSFSTLPSYQFEYSNLGYALLGGVITKVAGIEYQQYIRDEVLIPLGMNDTFWEYAKVPAGQLAKGYRWQDGRYQAEPMLHTGAFGSIGGLITSLRDWSKYVAFHLAAWPPRNEPDRGPLKRSSVREMHRRATSRLSGADSNCPSVRGYGYGLGIGTDCRGVTEVGHSGGLPGFGSNYRFYPAHGIAILSFANRTYASARTANGKAMQRLFEQSGIQPRQVPVSRVLKERTAQAAQLVQSWDEQLGADVLADNFYLDFSRSTRMARARKVLAEAGKIERVGPVEPSNQLRGTFVMHGAKQDIEVFFSLSPERVPKIQKLTLQLAQRSSK